MEIQLFEPYEIQQDIIDSLENHNIFFVIGVLARQCGKSLLGLNMALFWSINNPGSIVYWISPTDAQMQKVYAEIVNAIIESGCIERKTGSKGSTQIEFKNKSKILFRSAASEDSLRGESVDYMIMDEAAFIKKSTVEEILLPMLSARGKKCFILTTPKGKNWIFDWYKMGLGSNLKYKSFRASSYDSPYVNKDIIEMFRQSMSPALFKQEIEAEFVDSSSIFNNIPELMVLDILDNPTVGQKYYAGIDIGLINDASVLSIIDGSGNLVKYYRWTNIESPDLINNIIEISNQWKFQKLYIENNNQGLPIYQDLKQKIKIEQFNTNTKTKLELINSLIHLFNTRAIKLIKDEYLKLELEGYIFKQSDAGNIKFMADYGYHDDCVMSLAIAVQCYYDNVHSALPEVYTFNFKKRY